MLKSSFYCDNAVSCGQRMATLIGQYSRMTIKLQELAIKANLGLLWYLQTVAIVKVKLWLLWDVKTVKNRHYVTFSTGDETIKWRVLKQCKPYSSISNKCNLCLFEKYVIICKKNLCSLNKRNELASSCPHRTRYLLKNFVVK